MSQGMLSSIESKINMELKSVESTSADMSGIVKSIAQTIEDSVGENARASISGIRDSFASNVGLGLTKAKETTWRLSTGYSSILGLTGQSALILSQAHSILNGLGDI